MAVGARAIVRRGSPDGLARRALRLGAILLAAWCCLRWILAIPLPFIAGQGGLDYRIFRASALALLGGGDPYTLPPEFFPNLNHPAVTLLALPFALLPERWGFAAWVVASVFCYLLALGLAVITVGVPRAVWCRPLPLVLVLTYAGFASAIFMGQISPFLAPLLVVTWALARRGRFVAAATLLGALIALKLALLPLSALIVVRLVWREIAALGLGASVVSLAALPFVGIRGYRHWLALLSDVDYTALNTTNMSAVGLLYRIAPEAPRALATLGIVAACAIGLALARRAAPAGWHRVDWRVATLLPLALLSSPIAWDHYGPFLIPVAAITVVAWGRTPRRMRILLGCAAVCLLGALDLELLLGAVGLPAPHSGTILCAGLLLLLAAFLGSHLAAPDAA